MSKESTQHATIATDVPELITLFIGLESTEETSAESNRTKATVLLGEHFPSFTITEGTVFFRGAREPVLLVHIATPTPTKSVINSGTFFAIVACCVDSLLMGWIDIWRL